jgi:hypothetical protein
MTTENIIPYELIDELMMEVERYGIPDRKWRIDKFRENYKDCSSALECFEKRLNSFCRAKINYVEELQKKIKGNDSESRYLLGMVFQILISIEDNERLQKIIAGGADVEVSIGIEGLRPLHVAAQAGNIVAMEALIEAGADVNAQTFDKSTPLHCCYNNTQATALLLRSGANPFIYNLDGNPPWKFMKKDIAEVYKNEGFPVEVTGGDYV